MNVMLEYIKSHTKGNPIKSEQLESFFHITAREVRHEIEQLRREGFIIGSNSEGYYFADSYEDIEKAVTNYKKQIYTMLKTYGKMKVRLKNFGQLTLR